MLRLDSGVCKVVPKLIPPRGGPNSQRLSAGCRGFPKACQWRCHIVLTCLQHATLLLQQRVVCLLYCMLSAGSALCTAGCARMVFLCFSGTVGLQVWIAASTCEVLFSVASCSHCWVVVGFDLLLVWACSWAVCSTGLLRQLVLSAALECSCSA
jgi:hypothetical protein